MLFIAEIFRHGQGGKGHAQARPRRLVHLAVHQGHLGLLRLFQINDAGFNHFIVQVVPFAGAFPHPGKNGKAAARLGDVVDQLHDEHGLAHAGTAERADLAAFQEGADQVDHLDARFQYLRTGGLFVQGGSAAVDASHPGAVRLAPLVHGFTQNIENAAQNARSHRHFNGVAQIAHGHAAAQAVRGTHGHGAHPAVADVLLDFQHQGLALPVDLIIHFQGIEQGGKRFGPGKIGIDNGADDLNESACLIHNEKMLILKYDEGKSCLRDG